MTDVVHDRRALAAARSSARGRVALVPTMGALHAGHAALVDAARAAADTVVVSVFVNPAQFGPGEDYDAYPRTLEADVELCARHGADLVWAPAVADVYPAGPAQVRPDPGPLGAILEGASRPTHFAGMLTVVAKLFGLTRPDVAFFGQKDYQQLALIMRMVLDLELGIEIVGVPTVREPDGLALSSRNRYLSATQRRHALALSRALFAGAAAADHGADAVRSAAAAVLDGAPGIDVDYLALRAADLGPARGGESRLLVAARVGPARLIDNVAVHLPADHAGSSDPGNEESDDAARD